MIHCHLDSKGETVSAVCVGLIYNKQEAERERGWHFFVGSRGRKQGRYKRVQNPPEVCGPTTTIHAPLRCRQQTNGTILSLFIHKRKNTKPTIKKAPALLLVFKDSQIVAIVQAGNAHKFLCQCVKHSPYCNRWYAVVNRCK